MQTIRDTAKAKFLRADLADDPGQFLNYLWPLVFLTPIAGQDARLKRLLSFLLWWPQYCSSPVKLRFYFLRYISRQPSIVERIVEGYIIHGEPIEQNCLYAQREPVPELLPGRAVRLPFRLGRLETAEEEEGGVLWVENTILPRTREQQLAILASGATRGGVLFPAGTPPEVRDYLLNPRWWPLHSGRDAIRIRIDYAGAAEPVRGYLARDGAGFIYVQCRREGGWAELVDFSKIKILSASNISRYRRFGKVELQPRM